MLFFTYLPHSRVFSFPGAALSSFRAKVVLESLYMNAITYDNENNLKTSVYSIDGLQQASWSYIWGPQGLEYANKNSGALTQNFTTDSRGRILSMSYTSATYSGELYFHYDALGNTSLIKDANSNPKASFQYDLHTGRLIQSWNPDNLEIINLNDGITGSINLTAIRAPGLGKDITIQSYPLVKIGSSTNGDNWGTISIPLIPIIPWPKKPDSIFPGYNPDTHPGCCYYTGTDYEDFEGEWDEAGWVNPPNENEGKNDYNCREALQDYRIAMCEYLMEEWGTDKKEQSAASARLTACVAQKHGCKWAGENSPVWNNSQRDKIGDDWVYNRVDPKTGFPNVPRAGFPRSNNWDFQTQAEADCKNEIWGIR